MPDNINSGELEHFVADMIPAGDPVWPRSQRYIDDIPRCERKFQEKKIVRAKVHSWISTREEPGFMGQAIYKKDLSVDGILSNSFVSWLQELFSI